MSQVTDLANYRRQRAAEAEDTPVVVERERDPELPNRSHYMIVSRSCAAVQNAINGLIAEVESFGNGHGRFYGPHRFDGLFYATGIVVVFLDEGENRQ